MAAVLPSIPEVNNAHEVFMDMPQPTVSAFALAEELGLEKVFETARMYSDHEPEIDLNRIFGVTTFELG